jgi:hypothetical protein
MSNPLPLTQLPPSSVEVLEKAPEKPKLSLVPNPSPTLPDISAVLQLYRTQNRQCWLCGKIAANLEAGKKLAEDDEWHFVTCVSSWNNLKSI